MHPLISAFLNWQKALHEPYDGSPRWAENVNHWFNFYQELAGDRPIPNTYAEAF